MPNGQGSSLPASAPAPVAAPAAPAQATTIKPNDLRGILKYVPRFQGQIFVIAIDGAIIADENFNNLLVDIAVLRSLGIKIVLVHGIGHQLRELAILRNVPITSHDGTGITDAATLDLSIRAGSRVSHLILEGLTHFHVGRDSKADKLLLGETSTLTDIAKNDSGRIQECIALQRILLKFTTKLFLTGDLVGRLEEKIEALVEDKQVTSAFYFLPNTFPPPSSIHPLQRAGSQAANSLIVFCCQSVFRGVQEYPEVFQFGPHTRLLSEHVNHFSEVVILSRSEKIHCSERVILCSEEMCPLAGANCHIQIPRGGLRG